MKMAKLTDDGNTFAHTNVKNKKASQLKANSLRLWLYFFFVSQRFKHTQAAPLCLAHSGLGSTTHTHTHSTQHTLTLSPEAQAPLGHGDLPVLVGVAGVEEGSDADLVLVQVDGRQLGLAQIQIAIGVQFGKHPSDGVLAAGSKAPIQGCRGRGGIAPCFTPLHISSQTQPC